MLISGIDTMDKARQYDRMQPSGLTKRPLGRILVDAGLVTEERIEAALKEQHRTNDLLGDILVRLGAIERSDLNVVLSIQKELVSPDDAVRLAAGVRKALGELLIKAGRITEGQLSSALSEQKVTGERLGEILVRKGLLRPEELDTVLRFQKNQESSERSPGRLTLGEILVSAGVITRGQLHDALARQRQSGKRLGEVLVEAGYADSKAVSKGLRLQDMLLSAVLATAIALAPTSSAMSEERPSSAPAARVSVSATVMARASLNVIRQPAEVVVTDRDVKRGFVDVEAATLIELRSNSPAGCLLIFENHGLPVKETVVKGLDRDITIDPAGGMVTQRVQGTRAVVLSYRFVLSKDASPGTYAWPLSMTVSPL